MPPRHLRVAVSKLIGQRAGDLAKQQHPLQHRITQDIFGVPAVPGHAASLAVLRRSYAGDNQPPMIARDNYQGVTAPCIPSPA